MMKNRQDDLLDLDNDLDFREDKDKVSSGIINKKNEDSFENNTGTETNMPNPGLKNDSVQDVNHSWQMFFESLQPYINDPKLKMRQPDFPRKALHVDADLYLTLQDLHIGQLAATHILNLMLRAFIKSNIKSLLQFRKQQIPTVFASTQIG